MKDAGIPGQFTQSILEAEARFGQRVVMLVDEYGKLILDNLTQADVACEMRDGLRDLYSVSGNPHSGSIFRNAEANRKAVWMATGVTQAMTKRAWIAACRKS